MFAQQTINATINHDGLQREYILYVPSSYSSGTPVPLVFNFHGYTSNANDQMWYGDFRPIADTAGFIIAHPMGTKDNQGITFWNVGWGPETVDDIGFTSALIDSISSDYNIDQNRIYSTGMSNGGFMSYELACELSNRIAAIASVTGSMGPGMLLSCQPKHPTPAMQIHGTADGVVPYNGANFSLHIDSAVKYWVDYNNCNQTPVVTSVPNTSLIDGSTVTHYAYNNGNNGVSVELFKVALGAHTWPGSLFAGTGTNHDIDASEEIWNFFSRYDINGLINNIDETLHNNDPKIYPNPVSSVLNIELNVKSRTKLALTDMAGHTLKYAQINSNLHKLDMSDLSKGVYFLNIKNKPYKVIKSK
jgi:polyhydroxybutyrate depolymerase